VTERQLRIEFSSSASVSGLLTEAGAGERWLFVYAPGAGSNLSDPFAAFAARVLPDAGVDVLRFQFPYQETKRGGPDSNAVLEATWRAVIDEARKLAGERRLAVGGRSMGGRIASQVVAAGAAVDALALFAYPLHPPGRPQQMRDAHLGAMAAPALFCSGTRDAFGSPAELADAAAKAKGSKVHLLEGADHGFAVAKASGRQREDVWREACDVLAGFLLDLDL
jgi:uncharacterized protein